MPSQTIGYSDCPLCGEDITASDGSSRLGEHLANCGGRPAVRRRLTKRAREIRRRRSDRGLSPTEGVYMLLAFLGLGAVVPGWVYWVDSSAGALSAEATFLATFTLPAVVFLYLVGWVG